MFIKTRICDRCHKSVEDDSDGIRHFGLFCEGGPIKTRVNQRERPGTGIGFPTRDLSLGDYCSFACLQAEVGEWLEQFRKFKNWEPNDGKKGNS